MLRQVTSLSEAAALATFGIPFETKRLFIERTGRESVTWNFAASDPTGAFRPGKILLDHAERRLPPDHPFPLILRAIETIAALTSAASPLLRNLPGIDPASVAFRTTDPHAAAILHVLDRPLLHAEGTPPSRWTFAVSPAHAPGDTSATDAILAHRAGSLSPDHLVTWLFTGLQNHEVLRRLTPTSPRRILLQPPGSFQRHASLPEHATTRQLDEVRRFFAV